jgi:hypothetical protein
LGSASLAGYFRGFNEKRPQAGQNAYPKLRRTANLRARSDLACLASSFLRVFTY